MISGSGAFHFAVQYSMITLGVKLSCESFKLEVCNDHISQNHSAAILLFPDGTTWVNTVPLLVSFG